ncbi:MAG: hypothetical protein COA42_11535, partial [Alteromonadaceae bacterium]
MNIMVSKIKYFKNIEGSMRSVLFDTYAKMILLFIAMVSVPAFSAVPAVPGTPWGGGEYYHPINSTITITWSRQGGATYYLVNGANVGSSLSKTYSYSTYGGRAFKVQACNSDGCSAQSSGRNIWVYTAPGSVNNLSAASSSAREGSSVGIAWSLPGGGVTGVTYNVSVNNVFKTITSSTAYTLSVAAGSNSVRVYACNPEGVGCGSSKTVTVIGTPPAPGRASSLTSPSSRFQPINTNVTLAWPSVSSATNYRLYEDGTRIYSGSGRSFIQNHSQFGSRSYTVRACNSGGCGTSSNPYSIYYYTGPGGVVNLSAASSSARAGSSVGISWGAPGGSVPGVVYNVYVNNALRTTTSGTGYTLSVAAGSNSVRVYACNPQGAGCGSSSTVAVNGTLGIPSVPVAPVISNSYHPINTSIPIIWPEASSGITLKHYYTE